VSIDEKTYRDNSAPSTSPTDKISIIQREGTNLDFHKVSNERARMKKNHTCISISKQDSLKLYASFEAVKLILH
jgi:hypothetical protein